MCRCFKGTWWAPRRHLSRRVVCFCVYPRSVCMLPSFTRLFAGLCDVSSPRQYILFIICWAAALLRLCCPAGFLSPRRSSWSRPGQTVTGRVGGQFQIVVVCSDSRPRLWMWSACTSGFNSSRASVFDEHICQDKLRVATIRCSYVFSATLYSATVTQVPSLGINECFCCDGSPVTLSRAF